jgi:hypothetical protein
MINYFDYLRNKFPLYIISGVILAVIAFTSVLAYRYDKHLYDVLYDMQNMRLNKGRINEQVRDIDSMVDYFETRYKLDISDISPERQILSTLDRIKSRLPDAHITVASFEKKKGNLQLPLNIQLNVTSYRGLVNSIGYIESLGIPDYKIERLQISEGQLSGLVLMLSGALSMPAS